MFLRYHTDIWNIGIVPLPIEQSLEGFSIEQEKIWWLPAGKPFTFIADPFGVWRDGNLHIFAESYDYRTKHGYIKGFILGSDYTIKEEFVALKEPWHLSYPFLIEDEGKIYMLPEAHRSGKLTLYQANQFPKIWEAVSIIDLGIPMVDASIIHFQGLWWMFFSPARNDKEKLDSLYIAYSETLKESWKLHSKNPVRQDIKSSRPGGTPVIYGNKVFLPTQDCSRTYGGAINWIRFDRLDTSNIETSIQSSLIPAMVSTFYKAGLHTVSTCGPHTLIDAKIIDNSPLRALVNIKRRWQRLLKRNR